jgi:hypothetical protein
MSDALMKSQLAGSKQISGMSRVSAGRVAAEWLRFAAAPTFALMALLTAYEGSRQDVLCAFMQDKTPLTGMVPMYLLMSAFHLSPWLKLISS